MLDGFTCRGPCARARCRERACAWSWRSHTAWRGNQGGAWHCHSNGALWRFRRGSWETPRSRRDALLCITPWRRWPASGRCWGVWRGRPAQPRSAARSAGTAGGRRTRHGPTRSRPACTSRGTTRRCSACYRTPAKPQRNSRNYAERHKMAFSISPTFETWSK